MSYIKSTIGTILMELVHKVKCNSIASYFVFFHYFPGAASLYRYYYILNKNVEFMHTKNNNNNDEIIILIYQTFF